MNEELVCAGCGARLPEGASICPSCGWDLAVSVVTRPPRSPAAMLRAALPRLVVYPALIAVLVAGLVRLRTTGPGPDLATTVRWMALGDGGRAAELVTIHRAYEIAGAAARYAVAHLEAPAFDGQWAERLAPFATMNVRGWIPLLFYGAVTGGAPASLRELYEVRAVDGWGRPYRVTTRELPRGQQWQDDPEVATDLAHGLMVSLFARGRPDLAAADWLRLELGSGGRDRRLGTADDLRLVSYLQVGRTLHVSHDLARVQRELEVAYTRGVHYFYLEGAHYDLVDARLLGEHRLELLR